MAKTPKQPVASLEDAMSGLPDEFAFFADAWRDHVEPDLAQREDRRIAAIAKQQLWLSIAVVGGAALAAIGVLFFKSPAAVILVGVAGFGLYHWASQDVALLARETKSILVNPVSREFGMDYEAAPLEPGEMSRLRDLGLVPSWDRAKFEDRLAGKREDVPFEFFEAHLEEKRRGNKGRTYWATVFRGQCLLVHFHKPIEGVTKVYRDAGVFNSLVKLGQRHERVRLEDPKFEKAFEVYASDQIEARYILTPDFMERLLALEETFRGKGLRCAFSGRDMLLAVEGRNLFEPGSMERPMNDPARVRGILQDFAAVFLLIDSMSRRIMPDRRPR